MIRFHSKEFRSSHKKLTNRITRCWITIITQITFSIESGLFAVCALLRRNVTDDRRLEKCGLTRRFHDWMRRLDLSQLSFSASRDLTKLPYGRSRFIQNWDSSSGYCSTVIAVPGSPNGLQESLLPSSCLRFVLLVDGEVSSINAWRNNSETRGSVESTFIQTNNKALALIQKSSIHRCLSFVSDRFRRGCAYRCRSISVPSFSTLLALILYLLWRGDLTSLSSSAWQRSMRCHIFFIKILTQNRGMN